MDAKRILGVMGLGVKKDQEIVLKAEGSDEDQAIENCQSFCRKISKKKSVGRRYVLWWNYKEKVFFSGIAIGRISVLEKGDQLVKRHPCSGDGRGTCTL